MITTPVLRLARRRRALTKTMTMSAVERSMDDMDWSESGKGAFARTTGDRVRQVREQRGIRSARELAEAIPNPRLTPKVISNIELGRKVDLTVVELLEIAHALGVSPQSLLVDQARPYEPTAIPGVSEQISEMTAIDFLEWLSLPFEAHPLLMAPTIGAPEDTTLLIALRQYEVQRRLVEHHVELVRTAIRANEQFPDFNDVAHLRRQAAESRDELVRQAAFLRDRGIEIADDHADHSLTTTWGEPRR
ncbi:XRE family transcriptional regulator [Kocuria marina subsp. indica]|nr:XRE family transcriptional regulator [Kocuria indica]